MVKTRAPITPLAINRSAAGRQLAGFPAVPGSLHRDVWSVTGGKKRDEVGLAESKRKNGFERKKAGQMVCHAISRLERGMVEKIGSDFTTIRQSYTVA